MQKREKNLTIEQLDEIQKVNESDPHFSILQNIINNVEMDKIIVMKKVVEKDPKYSSDLVKDWKTTDQKRSGRCWIFAATNVLRIQLMKKFELKNFELSQSYIAFWDKVERANYFLEIAIANRDKHFDDRTWQYCLTQIVSDGGQWDMVVNIIKKYGIVPKSNFDETTSSSKTYTMRKHLRVILQNAAMILRKCTKEEIEKHKLEAMKIVYRCLLLHYGSPPKSFTFELKSKKHVVTPLEFLEKFVDNTILEEGISLIHDPRKENLCGKLYTVNYLGNIWDKPVTYLNITMDEMIDYVKKTIVEKSEPVFFGCDYGKSLDKSSGTMNPELFIFDKLYGTSIDMTKEDRLRLNATKMTHAMVIVGVDETKEEGVIKFKVENSHGTKKARDGFLLMTTEWFREHNFQVVVRKSILDEKLQAVVNDGKYFKVLPAWDPMGALAN